MVAHIVLLILVILSCSAVLPLRNKPAVTSKEMGALSRVSLKFACFIAYLTTCTLLIWLALQALDGIRGVSLVGGGVDTQKIHTRWRKVIDLDPMVILAWRHCSECKAPAQGDRTAATDLESALQRDIREIASSNRWPSNAETQSLQGAAIPSWFRETVESSLSVAISEKEPVREVFAIAVGGDKSEAWNPATEILRSRNVAPYIDDLQKASAGAYDWRPSSELETLGLGLPLGESSLVMELSCASVYLFAKPRMQSSNPSFHHRAL